MRIVFMLDRPIAPPADFDGTHPCVRLKKNNWNDYGFEITFQAMLCPELPFELLLWNGRKVPKPVIEQRFYEWRLTTHFQTFAA